MPQTRRPAISALATLIVLQLVMLTALYAKTPPHPPEAIALFGMAPFLGASLSAALVAIVMGATETRTGKLFSLAACAMALISYGPHKYLDPQIGLIWPSVVAGQIAVLTLVALIARPNFAGHKANTLNLA